MSVMHKVSFLECPKCSGRLDRCKDSRPDETTFPGMKAIKRRRLCNDCGVRSSTIEVPIDSMTGTKTRERAWLDHPDVAALIGKLLMRGDIK